MIVRFHSYAAEERVQQPKKHVLGAVLTDMATYMHQQGSEDLVFIDGTVMNVRRVNDGFEVSTDGAFSVTFNSNEWAQVRRTTTQEDELSAMSRNFDGLISQLNISDERRKRAKSELSTLVRWLFLGLDNADSD